MLLVTSSTYRLELAVSAYSTRAPAVGTQCSQGQRPLGAASMVASRTGASVLSCQHIPAMTHQCWLQVTALSICATTHGTRACTAIHPSAQSHVCCVLPNLST